MRAEYLPGDPHGGSLHLAFGKTPSAYIKPADAGTATYRDIYWRFDLRLQPGRTGGGADKLTRATILSSDRFTQAAIGHLWIGSSPDSDPERLYLDPASGTLNLVTNKTYSCSCDFVIPPLNFYQLLPDTGTVQVPIPAQAAGSKLFFTCSMGMYTGQIVFE